jgi:hypothetical protein
LTRHEQVAFDPYVHRRRASDHAFDPYVHRRRASDRARERAGRAAWYGDRAGLLIATSVAESLMTMRSRRQGDMSPDREAPDYRD